jgi:hypothetical protein
VKYGSALGRRRRAPIGFGHCPAVSHSDPESTKSEDDAGAYDDHDEDAYNQILKTTIRTGRTNMRKGHHSLRGFRANHNSCLMNLRSRLHIKIRAKHNGHLIKPPSCFYVKVLTNSHPQHSLEQFLSNHTRKV